MKNRIKLSKPIIVIIFACILTMVVGYAAVNIVLDIKVNVLISDLYEDYDLYIGNVKQNDINIYNSINEEHSAFSIQTKANKLESSLVTSYIVNNSTQYDFEYSFECTLVSDDATLALGFEYSATKTVASQQNGDYEIRYNITTAATNPESNATINCTLIKNPVGTTEIAEKTKALMFSADGASISTYVKIIDEYATLGELPEPEKTGYAFMGWYTINNTNDDDYLVTVDTLVNDMNDQVLYAAFTKKESTEIYYNNSLSGLKDTNNEDCTTLQCAIDALALAINEAA